MSREDPQMKIRLPADLKDRIEAASKEAGRSMNAEIVTRLEGSFATTPLVSPSANPPLRERPKVLDLAIKLRELQTQRDAISSLMTEVKKKNPASKALKFIAAELLGVEWDIGRVEELITELFISNDESPEILEKIKTLAAG